MYKFRGILLASVRILVLYKSCKISIESLLSVKYFIILIKYQELYDV